jgi:hypothetical protein
MTAFDFEGNDWDDITESEKRAIVGRIVAERDALSDDYETLVREHDLCAALRGAAAQADGGEHAAREMLRETRRCIPPHGSLDDLLDGDATVEEHRRYPAAEQVRHDLRAAQADTAPGGGLREALAALLEVQDEECRFDHDGNCQAHYVEKPCRVAMARAALLAADGRNTEEPS